MNHRFREDENELPYLVSSKRDNGFPKKQYNNINEEKLFETVNQLLGEKELDEAMTIINMLIDRHPDSARYWNMKALIYDKMTEGQFNFERPYEESIKCLNIAIKLEPNNRIFICNKCEILTDYGRQLQITGQYSYAMSKLDEALSLLDEKTDDPLLFSNAWYFKALCLHSVGSPEAFECYDNALKYNPKIKETVEQRKHELHRYQGIDSEYFYG